VAVWRIYYKQIKKEEKEEAHMTIKCLTCMNHKNAMVITFQIIPKVKGTLYILYNT